MRGPYWTPITPLTGSFLHAGPQLLRELNEADPDMLDPRWAEGSASVLIQQLVAAARRRTELAEKLQNELWSTR